ETALEVSRSNGHAHLLHTRPTSPRLRGEVGFRAERKRSEPPGRSARGLVRGQAGEAEQAARPRVNLSSVGWATARYLGAAWWANSRSRRSPPSALQQANLPTLRSQDYQ